MITRRHLLGLLPAGLLAGCSEEAPAPRPKFPKVPFRVTATTQFAADFAGIIGGKTVQVQNLLPPGVSPDSFVPNAPHIARLRTSDIVITHGLGLERRWKVDFEELAKSGVRVFSATSKIPAEKILHPSGPGGPPDPHVWTNPELASLMVDAVEAALKEVMPDLAGYFGQRAHPLRLRFGEIMGRAKQMGKELKPEARFLLTTHDSVQYFAAAFSIKTRSLTAADGTIPDKLPDSLKEWIGQHSVKNIFRESSADADVVRRMVFELRVDPVNVIHSLTLPPPDTNVVTAYKTYSVGSAAGAIQYLCEIILNTLAVN